MAFTEQEEIKLRSVITAFDGAVKVSDLPKGEGGIEDYEIEAQRTSTGESVRVNLSKAISTVNKRIAMRRWDETTSTPLGDAYGNIDFLRELPSTLGLGCYLVTDDRQKRKLDPTNHYRFEDGSPAALDGTMGQYLWCWNEHYYTSWKEGNYFYEAVSLSPIEGKECYFIPAGGISATSTGVMDRTNLKLCSVINDTPQFRGGGNNATYDGTYRTFLGRGASSIDLVSFSAYARKRGEGWEANWFVARAVQEYLFRIIMGTRNSQSAFNPEKDANGLFQGGLGAGMSNMGNLWGSHNGRYPFLHTSAGIELGDGVGAVPHDVIGENGEVVFSGEIPVFFGLKNMYGYVWLGVRGLITDVQEELTQTFVAPSLYAGQSNTNFDGMILAATQPNVTGYIKKISMNKLCCMPTEVGASTGTYYSDYFGHNPAIHGLRCRLSSGASDPGAAAGAFCTNSKDAVAHSCTSVSSPLCYFEEDPIMF